MAKVVSAVENLSKEVAELKKEKVAPASTPASTPANESKPVPTKRVTWADKTKENVKQSNKVTVCIKKTDESNLDIKKVKEVVTQHGLQVSKVSVNQKNGDLYVDFPSDEQCDKLVPLLTAEQGNNVINIKSKCPVITIRNVSNFVDKDTFIAAVKSQNPQISEKIENGSEFSVLFTKEQKASEAARNTNSENESRHQVVVRISEDIRQCIKDNQDRIYIGVQAYRIFDRFYVKSCASCHRFGHYHAECENNPCCGYCGDENHTSQECPIHEQKLQEQYKCVNCQDAGKPGDGHSSHWHNCPTYLEKQKKVMMSIPYYAKNSK